MQNKHNQNNWSDVTNSQKNCTKDEQYNPNQRNKQTEQTKQARQNNKADQRKNQNQNVDF